MRKITADIQNAIRTQSKFKGANTEITDGIVRFHGHIIAKQCPISGVWSFCFQGYRATVSTQYGEHLACPLCRSPSFTMLDRC